MLIPRGRPNPFLGHAYCTQLIHRLSLCGMTLTVLPHTFMNVAGGIMLQAGAHTDIDDSTISNCTALAGGGVCTDMADASSAAEKGADITAFDRQTHLNVSANFSGNAGGNVTAGPYFELRFDATRPGGINWYSKGVQWWTRLCDTGDYLSGSGFCEPCPANTYSMQRVEAPSRGHNSTECTKAPPTGYAPGGAMLIALGQHWHHPTTRFPNKIRPYPGCADCHINDPWTPDVQEIRRWVGRGSMHA